MRFCSITEADNLQGKRVLVRLDLNVPIVKGKIADDFKIERSLPTVQYLERQGARVIIAAHLGRPARVTPALSLKPVQRYLERALGQTIPLVNVGRTPRWENLRRRAAALKNGRALLLENIRFIAGENENDPAVARELAGLADLFVLDGFGVAHRAAASVSGVARLLPSYAGLLIVEEIDVLSAAVAQPKNPLVVILGGAKAETKIPVLKHVLRRADYILLGGSLVNTYLAAIGCRLGASLVDTTSAKELLAYGKKRKVILPVDVIVGSAMGKGARRVPIKGLSDLPATQGIYDIGPETVRLFARYITSAATIIWNGAMGKFEQFPYGYGTKAIACLVAARAKGRAVGIVGGGETVEVIRQLGLLRDFDLVSTGGGAMLAFLSGASLPGIAALGRAVKQKRRA